jgi:D-lyxose ketol-isomerase
VLRSRVNQILREGEAFVASFGFRLPPFAAWEPERLIAARHTSPGVFAGRLGWDITDYGQGDWDRLGLLLFTLRNGDVRHLARGRGRLYAEKILVSRRDQLAPMHRHLSKAEDIIHRGGGDLIMELFASDAEGHLDERAPVEVPCDGRLVRLPAGGKLRLATGESVTLLPGTWHAFWGEGADVLLGEVSTVNDDLTDNVFREPIGRFPEIVEDEPAYRLLVSDYDAALGTSRR